MTSKDELQSLIELDVLCERCRYTNNCPYAEHTCDTYEIIKKDLEILEILKQYIIYKDYGCGMESYELNKTIHRANYSYGKGWKKELEELNKIKEWLNG